MMRQASWLITLFILALVTPQAAFAADIFSSPASDQSIYYLTELFGQVGNILTPAQVSTSIMPEYFRIINITILSLGVFVVTWSTIMSAIAAGRDGEPMAKKWGGSSIPLRVTIGMALLLPFRGGYCLAQIIMMYIITQGVGAANQLWTVVLETYTAGYSVSVPIPLLQLDVTGERLFQMATCAALANEDPTLFTMNRSSIVGMYPDGPTTLKVGVQGSPQFSRICGVIEMIPLDDVTHEAISASERADFFDLQKSAFLTTFRHMDLAAEEALRSPRSQIVEKGVVSRAKMELSSYYEQLRLLDFLSPDIANNEMASNAQADGWMYAGAFYSKLVGRNSAISSGLNRVPLPSMYNPSTDKTNNDNIVDQARTLYTEKANAYILRAEENAVSIMPGDNIGGLNGSRKSMGIFDIIFGKIFSDTSKFFEKFLTQSAKHTSYSDGGVTISDPLLSLGLAGNTILQIVEYAYVVGFIIIMLLIFAGCVKSGENPACFGVGAMTKVILPLITFMVSVLLSGAVTLGIYIPMIPYMQYTFGTLSWFILVIEAFAAAPLVALGLASPAPDKFGKAGHAIMLAANLFMRPPLMVLGFVFAARTLIAVFDLFNYSFSATFASAVGSLGFFGIAAVIVIYAGICSILVNEVFQLIHLLPDKVIRWVGGVAEQTVSRALDMTQQAEQTSKSASAVGQQGAVAAIKFLGKQLEKDKDKKEESTASEGDKNPKTKKNKKGSSEDDDETTSPPTNQTTPPANGLAGPEPSDTGGDTNDTDQGGSTTTPPKNIP